MTHHHRRRARALIWLLPLLGLQLSHDARAGSNNVEHELVVYSLKNYAQYLTVNWKGSVVPWYTNQDPYQDFWASMYNCSGDECANTYSARFQDSQVTVNQMATSHATSSDRGWSNSDFVVFYGHNTQVKPQWSETFSLWRFNSEFNQWYHHDITDWSNWGTSSEPYEYHRSWVSNASLSNAYAVFYGYNPFTSILVGNARDFPTSGTWYTENTWNGSTDTRDNHFNGELEWIIADGCNAVSTADPDGNALSLGAAAWSKAWDGLHMVMGHYYVTDTSRLPNLQAYAGDLKAGGLMQPSYFNRHTCTAPPGEAAGYCQPSAIEIQYNYICFPPPCPTAYMDSDKWHPNNKSDITSNYRYHSRWNVSQ